MSEVTERDLVHAVETFIYREASLLDARDYSAWLELFAEELVYWIPCVGDDIDPAREVSIVYDDRALLAERVWRLESGLAYAQEPQSRTCHLVANVQVTSTDGESVFATCNLLVTEFRRGQQFAHSGRCTYLLKTIDEGGFQIASKKIDLINNDGHIGNLSVLL